MRDLTVLILHPLPTVAPLGNPEICPLPDGGGGWIWRDRLLFGGIRGTATTHRATRPSIPMFPKGLPTFHCFELSTRPELDLRRDIAALSLRDLHQLVRDDIETLGALQRRIHDGIEAAVGPASYSCAGYGFGLPKIVWQSESLQYHCHASQTGELSVTVTVEHHTNDYPELKAAAQRHWAGISPLRPRFDFVGWDCEDPRIPADARSKHRENLANELRRLERELFTTVHRVE